MNRTLAQQRASFSLLCIQGFKQAVESLPDDDKRKKKLQKMATHISKTPIRIINHGLGQALAFLLSDNEGKHGTERKESGQLYDWLQDWLCGINDNSHGCRVYPNPSSNLIQQLVENDRQYYVRAHEEALALFDWLKKFADAELGKRE